MDKSKKYIGIIIFFIVIIVATLIAIMFCIQPLTKKYMTLKDEELQISETLEKKKEAQKNIEIKLSKLKESILTSKKKIYSPIENNLDDDTLFFTLYSDVIEMIHSNSIKIDTIEYKYNPDGDNFVAQNGRYFVCDINLKLVSNYVNLGKLIQDIYQYPYYIRINNVDIYPYPKDKKILLTTMSVRLYARTSADIADETEVPPAEENKVQTKDEAEAELSEE